MRRSLPLSSLAVLIGLTASACSSADPSSPGASTGDPATVGGSDLADTSVPADASSVLDGEYVTSDAGPLEDITFGDGTYVMWPSSCPGSASCLSIGTYAISPDDTQITLTDGATGEATTFAYQALTAVGGALAASSGDVTLQALVMDAGPLSKDGGTLVKTTVSTATIGTQQVKLVTPVAKLVSSSNDDCVMSLPVTGDPSSFLAAAKKALAAKGGTLSGSTSSGSFSVPGPLGTVTGTYSVASSAATLKIAPASLGFLQSCSAVYSALKSALGS
jgi:hypothetical protein